MTTETSASILIECGLLPRSAGSGAHVVRAQPGVGFLLLGRPVTIAQMRGAIDDDHAAGFVSRSLITF